MKRINISSYKQISFENVVGVKVYRRVTTNVNSLVARHQQLISVMLLKISQPQNSKREEKPKSHRWGTDRATNEKCVREIKEEGTGEKCVREDNVCTDNIMQRESVCVTKEDTVEYRHYIRGMLLLYSVCSRRNETATTSHDYCRLHTGDDKFRNTEYASSTWHSA